eukprot:NODE_45_length_32908_cov_0.790271.p31 type:complete len:111 gc:universal NODE_45_length_32908_cov_0.790271:24508-24176(-)
MMALITLLSIAYGVKTFQIQQVKHFDLTYTAIKNTQNWLATGKVGIKSYKNIKMTFKHIKKHWSHYLDLDSPVWVKSGKCEKTKLVPSTDPRVKGSFIREIASHVRYCNK